MARRATAHALVAMGCALVALAGCFATAPRDPPCSYGYAGGEVRWVSRALYDALPSAGGSEA
ncbi:MAG: hypothetical protein ACYDBQ_07355 [Thermoplasmatota archaeon]